MPPVRQVQCVFVHEFGTARRRQGARPDAGDPGRCRRLHTDRAQSHPAGRQIQVWAIDRRTQALEDAGSSEQALDGKVDLQEAFDYYLGWITNGGTPADHFQFLESAGLPVCASNGE